LARQSVEIDVRAAFKEFGSGVLVKEDGFGLTGYTFEINDWFLLPR
jgi:hypothetical protein